jgi:hypothetical protein
MKNLTIEQFALKYYGVTPEQLRINYALEYGLEEGTEMYERFLDDWNTYNELYNTPETKEETAVQEVKADNVSMPIVRVFFELGYRWSVDVEGEGESRITNVTKKEAMALAKQIIKEEFGGNAILDEQKLTRKQKAENIAYLHATTETYHEHWRY